MKTAIKPFKHQTVSLKHDATTDVVFDCSDPGTGKTYVRIMSYALRRRKAKAGKLLVVAGKSLLKSVWFNDFKKFAPDIRVEVSQAGKHAEVFKRDCDVVVINHDAIKWLGRMNKKFFAEFTDIVIDESTAFKRPQSDRGRVAAKVAQWFKRRACLTGTPNGNTILDVWNQAYILDGGKRLGNSYYRFRDEVCHPVQVGRNQNAVKWEDREGAEEAVFSLLQDITMRHKLQECTDLPENHAYSLPYELTAIQQRSYMQMQDSMVMELFGDPMALERAKLTGKMPKPAGHLTAVHAASKMTKLLQISSGAVYDDAGNYHVIDNRRYEVVCDLIDERDHSVTFFLWKHQRDLLAKELTKRDMTFAVIDGNTPGNERADIVERFQKGAYRTILGHPLAISHGLTMTRGQATIWPSPTSNLEWYTQGARRVFRITQTRKTENITLVATGTYEEFVYQLLNTKDTRMNRLLDLFASPWSDK
jgi:SNF2 family DNA or RNA helicase